MIEAPLLSTDRLILRAHRLDDYPACQALWGDPQVVRHIGAAPQNAQAVWFRLLRYGGMWSLLGYGMWVMEARDSGAFLGEAGLLSAARGLPELDGWPEAGWALAPQAWGRGLACEAMAAILAWADAHLNTDSVRCIIENDNGASIKVAHRLGFTVMADATIGGKPVGIFDRLRRGT